MPASVPPAVAKSFAALFPAMITISIFGLIKVFTLVGGMPDIHQAFFDALQAPVSKLANTLWFGCCCCINHPRSLVFRTSRRQYYGTAYASVYLPAIEANAAAFAAAKKFLILLQSHSLMLSCI